MKGISFGLWNVTKVELFVLGNDFEYFEAFRNHKGGKLPELLELSVRVHDRRDVVYRVINRNSEIVGHFDSPLRLSREFFQRFVGVGKPDVVHIMQNGGIGL